MAHRREVIVRGRHVLLALTIVHPVPSAINAGLVAVVAGIAGAEPRTAALLAAAMLGFQSSIGALNDVVDADTDRLHKPRKPIPAGLVPVWLALALVGLGAAVGLGISASLGMAVFVLGVLGYATGVAYDLVLRRLGLGWLGFAAAFPLLLAWTWVGAAGVAPPGWPLLLSVAALAGPTIHLANSLADVDADEHVGRRSLATRLGPRRSEWVLAALMATVLVLAMDHDALGCPGLEPGHRSRVHRERHRDRGRRALVAARPSSPRSRLAVAGRGARRHGRRVAGLDDGRLAAPGKRSEV